MDHEQSAHQQISKKDVIYIHSSEYLLECCRLPRIMGRADLVHKLIEAQGLESVLTVVPPIRATECQLKCFHSEEYIDFFKKINNLSLEELEDITDEGEDYGLGYDCPIIPRLFDLVCYLAGGTLTAADKLKDGLALTAINWNGGWHHARKDEAAGFCYVNDVVLGILHLRQHFDKVLYVDLDIHHGDAVLDAFAYTPKVMCVSFHKYDSLYFPGTGSLKDVGQGKGRFYTVNVPLKDGITDSQYTYVCTSILNRVVKHFKPDAVVCQFGVDTLSEDPVGTFNLTLEGIESVLKFILSWKLPLLLLGGGGYLLTNAARAWTHLTSVILDVSVDRDIQDHSNFLLYGPDYEMKIQPSTRRNLNLDKQLEEIIGKVSENLQHVC